MKGSGYTWYKVAPVSFTGLEGPGQGWVAMAGKDGEPWIALADAPIAGIELAKADVARATADPADAKTAAASINAFGLDLLRAMLADGTLEPDKNAVFSPTSIALALAMARAGAKGETAAQMDAVLHTTGWDALGPGLNALEQALTSRNATWQDESSTRRPASWHCGSPTPPSPSVTGRSSRRTSSGSARPSGPVSASSTTAPTPRPPARRSTPG